MYSVNSNSRRITTYVKKEAYKWLFDKIVKNEYDVGNNRKAQKLVIDIKKEGCITEDSYLNFVSKVVYSPYEVMMRGFKACRKKYIVAHSIENFFMKYNGEILPIGFVKDFFEDDYETQAEVDKYIETVIRGQEEMFAIRCQEKLLQRNGDITEMKDERPYVFKTKVLFHVTNLIKAILTIATLFVCLNFLVENDIIRKIIEYSRDGDHYAFFDKYIFHVVWNFIVLFFLIFQVIKLIKTLIFYIRWGIIRIKVLLLEMKIKSFEGRQLEELREYFRSIQGELAQTHTLTDELCKGVPAAKRSYLVIDKFDTEKIKTQINKLYGSNRYSFLSAAYDENDELRFKAKKKVWKKKIIFRTLCLLFLCILNVEGVLEDIIDLINPLVEQITGNSLEDLFNW